MEQAIEASSLEWTHLHPVEYMSNALGWADSIRNEGVVREPFGHTLSAMIHEADIASVAATALIEEGHAGKSYILTGPEVLTVPEKVHAISSVINREIRFVELTRQQARERMHQSGIQNEVINFVIEWHDNPPEYGYTVLPTVEQVTGRKPRKFAQWVEEHIGDFS